MVKKGDKRTIFLAAGGTGGHIFPAIALGEELGRRGYNPVLVTDERTKKYLSVNEFISYEFIPVLYPYGSLTNKIKGSISQISSYFSVKKLIKKYEPLAVVGFGGYPSFPTLYASISRKVRTIIHEQNSVLGKANQMLSEKVDAIATSYPEVLRIEEEDLYKSAYTGNPIRPSIQMIRNLPYPRFDDNSPLNILVTGGSQGAGIFGRIIPEAIKLLPPEYRARIRIDQQCRPEDIDRVREEYKNIGINADIAPFFNDMPNRLVTCHLVICRSGASSLAELSAAGRPAIMIPLPTSKDGHQMINANSYEDQGAGWVMPEESFNAKSLSFKLENFFKLHSLLTEAAERSRQAGTPDADKKLADLIERVALNPESRKKKNR